MAFMAEPGMQLQALPGGRVPAFAGTGVPATQVCSSSSFDFTVSFTPDKKFKLGSTKVSSSSSSSDACAIMVVDSLYISP
jgi:hypothetical protein